MTRRPWPRILEQKFVAWLTAEAGFPAGAGGTLTAGGTQSNYMGLLLARDAFLKSRFQWPAQKRGLPPEAARMRVLCSEVAHFTVEKSAAQLGLGTDAVVRVAVDDEFRMRPESLRTALDEMRDKNLLPFAIVATAGTTDFGSVDPLPEIAALAQSAGAWLHVDAAYGGALLFSQRHRDKLEGIAAGGLHGHRFSQTILAADSGQRFPAARCSSLQAHRTARGLPQSGERTKNRAFPTW